LAKSIMLVFGLIVLPNISDGHHSHVNYVVSEFTQLEGVVREVHLINPHSWIYLEVQDGQDEPVIWALESTTPDGLLRNGIQPDFVRIGDRVQVRCHRQRDNHNACLLGFLTPLHGDSERGHGIEKEWD
ncbi:MAG: DUF6152 family protein, partial [Gammaproteobacteria bacterium]